MEYLTNVTTPCDPNIMLETSILFVMPFACMFIFPLLYGLLPYVFVEIAVLEVRLLVDVQRVQDRFLLYLEALDGVNRGPKR